MKLIYKVKKILILNIFDTNLLIYIEKNTRKRKSKIRHSSC